jgi:repressor LexA
MDKRGKHRREDVLRFVEASVRGNGYPPTYDEIRQACGLSSRSHVDYYIQALEKEGLIERTPRTPRGLRLVGLGPSTFDVSGEATAIASQFPEFAAP